MVDLRGRSCQTGKIRLRHDRRHKKSHVKRGNLARGMAAAKEKVMPNEEISLAA